MLSILHKNQHPVIVVLENFRISREIQHVDSILINLKLKNLEFIIFKASTKNIISFFKHNIVFDLVILDKEVNINCGEQNICLVPSSLLGCCEIKVSYFIALVY